MGSLATNREGGLPMSISRSRVSTLGARSAGGGLDDPSWVRRRDKVRHVPIRGESGHASFDLAVMSTLVGEPVPASPYRRLELLVGVGRESE